MDGKAVTPRRTAGGNTGGPGALASLVERVAREDPGRAALDAPGREPLRYGELFGLLGSVAGELRERGIGPHSRVVLVTPNGPEAATAFLALASAAACAPLNPSYRRHELDFYLEDLDADAVVVSRGLDTPVREAAAGRDVAVLELDTDPRLPAGVFRLDGRAVPRARPAGPSLDDLALLLHTSGTTARPKLVPLTERNLTASARHVAESLDLRPGDRCLNVMPLFHVHGLVAGLLASITAGGTVVCTPGFHPLHVFGWLADLDPTWITAVPTMHQALLARSAAHEDVVRDHRLRFVRSSSASLPVPVLEQLEQALGVPVVEAYGMTEAAHQIASNAPSPGVRTPGSVGPAAGPEIAVVSPAGDSVPVGEAGEVVIRGENVFAGYERNPEANAAAFVDGWFRTGDEGVLDEDGRLTLSGRIKEQINRGGEKVSPTEVDERLLAHPAVAEAVTFAMPDARLGEEVAAAVVLQTGSDAGQAELQGFVAETLAPFKVPRRVIVVDEIPKGPTGKIQRLGLVDALGLSPARQEPAGHVEPRTAFERLLAAVWSEVLGIPDVGIHDDFFSLGGDSVLGAEAVARIRELTGDDDLPLVSIVRSPTVAGMARELDRATSSLGRSGVFDLDPGAAGEPLFFVHGGDGEVLDLVGLARSLGPEWRLYGLRARGIDDGAEPHASIEEMAADYVDAIRSVRPHGPYALGGFCFGGAVALEMAHRFESAGETVSDLVLVDPRLPRPHDLRYSLWLVPRRLRERTLLLSILRRAARRPRGDPGTGAPSEIERALSRLREAHRSRSYFGPAVAIVSNDGARRDPPVWHLRRIVPNVTLTRLDVSHVSMLRPPAVASVARALVAALPRPR